jgi:hypothetical protein
LGWAADDEGLAAESGDEVDAAGRSSEDGIAAEYMSGVADGNVDGARNGGMRNFVSRVCNRLPKVAESRLMLVVGSVASPPVKVAPGKRWPNWPFLGAHVEERDTTGCVELKLAMERVAGKSSR